MSQTASITANLPYLRRFARALTGSQNSGDAYAIATLEAIAEDSGTADRRLEPRYSLYQVFLKIWGSLAVNQRSEGTSDNLAMQAADRTLEALTPLPRVVFLLRSLEGFSVPEIAKILERPQAEIQQLLDVAGREIASQLRTQVLIIEDEPIIAMDLEAMVLDLGHSVLQIARTHQEAVAAIADHAPGLVLADIQLADGSSGLDAVNEILMAGDVPVVFITAYPERLLTGDRPEPTFLITKPFRTDTVKAIISQALFFDRRAKLAATAAAR
jgi:CheY-like chemotaxis protein/DNA-directed RNA polymerase specialized sigma24 family protein